MESLDKFTPAHKREKIWFCEEYLHKRVWILYWCLAHTASKRFSNTYLFYKKRWKINIDALLGMDLFNKVRPKNDINLEVGSGYKEEEVIITCLMNDSK